MNAISPTRVAMPMVSRREDFWNTLATRPDDVLPSEFHGIRFRSEPDGKVKLGGGARVAVAFSEPSEKFPTPMVFRFHLDRSETSMDRAARYAAVQKHLAQLGARAPAEIVPPQFFPGGATFGDVQLDLSVMPLVEGMTLRSFVNANLETQRELRAKLELHPDTEQPEVTARLSALQTELLRLADELLAVSQKFSAVQFVHGDVSDLNVLVTPENKVRMIDPDANWVPGQAAGVEIGAESTQHPDRFDETKRAQTSAHDQVDRFSFIALIFSLKALALEPDLADARRGELLLTDQDFKAPIASPALRKIAGSREHPELKAMALAFIRFCAPGAYDKIPSVETFCRAGQPKTDVLERADEQQARTQAAAVIGASPSAQAPHVEAEQKSGEEGPYAWLIGRRLSGAVPLTSRPAVAPLTMQGTSIVKDPYASR